MFFLSFVNVDSIPHKLINEEGREVLSPLNNPQATEGYTIYCVILGSHNDRFAGGEIPWMG